MSSANIADFISSSPTLIPVIRGVVVSSLERGSSVISNNMGDNGHSWRVPLYSVIGEDSASGYC